MAGMAISPLLKINGEKAIAMACAAFCIPTSMTIVLRTAGVKPDKRESSELQSIAARIREAVASPSRAKFSIISFVYCRKKSNARSIRAGKAGNPAESGPGSNRDKQKHYILNQQFAHRKIHFRSCLLRHYMRGKLHNKRQGKQCYDTACSCHRYREGDIALGQHGEYVRGTASRAACNKHQPYFRMTRFCLS